jgi:hypothetical protein
MFYYGFLVNVCFFPENLSLSWVICWVKCDVVTSEHEVVTQTVSSTNYKISNSSTRQFVPTHKCCNPNWHAFKPISWSSASCLAQSAMNYLVTLTFAMCCSIISSFKISSISSWSGFLPPLDIPFREDITFHNLLFVSKPLIKTESLYSVLSRWLKVFAVW